MFLFLRDETTLEPCIDCARALNSELGEQFQRGEVFLWAEVRKTSVG